MCTSPREQRRQAGHSLGDPAECEFWDLWRVPPVLGHPAVEDMGADLALDKREGSRPHDLLAIQRLAPDIPARLALHHQVVIR